MILSSSQYLSVIMIDTTKTEKLKNLFKNVSYI